MESIRIYSPDIPLTDEMRRIIDKKFVEKILKHIESTNISFLGQLNINHNSSKEIYELSYDHRLPGKDEVYIKVSRDNFLSAVTDLETKVVREIKQHKST